MGTGEPVLSLYWRACVEPMGTGEPVLSLYGYWRTCGELYTVKWKCVFHILKVYAPCDMFTP